MNVNYTGKVRTKHKLTHKVKYFNSVEEVTNEYEVISICGSKTIKQVKEVKDMKLALHYKDLYKRLILYRQKNKLKEIFDNEVQQHHHIFPKSIFGKNDKVVLLTAFEHCLAHYYLFKMYKWAGKKTEAKKMGSAYNSLRLTCGFPYGVVGGKQFNHAKKSLEE